MPLIWNDTLSTGLREIDLQHQELIELINTLESASETGGCRQAIDDALSRLRAYVVFHFATEEALMMPSNGKHGDLHRRQHRDFMERISRVGLERSDHPDLSGLIDFLKEWLVTHIMKTDRELARQVFSRRR